MLGIASSHWVLNIQGGSGWKSRKHSSPKGGGDRLPRAVVMTQSCQSSVSIWTTFSVTWSEFWVVLCGANSGTPRSLRVPSNVGYSMVL